MNIEINSKLSIVIPTHNRALFLDYSLETHIPLAKEYNIPIYVSDNASSDNTNEIVNKWMKKYEFLYYYRNEENLGADINFELAMNKPTTDYIWLLGDTSEITESVISSVVEQSNDNYDLILLNDKGRVVDIETQLFSNRDILLSNLGWHMTQMSSLIFSSRIVKNANYLRFYDTNFIQVGIIFEYLSSQKKILISWNQDLSVKSLNKDGLKKISWEKDTFNIWTKRWVNFVFSLPPIYSLDSKLKMIRCHNQKTKIFSFRNLLLLRSKGYYGMNHYISFNKYFSLAVGGSPIFRFLCIAILPVKIVKYIILLNKKYFS